MKSIEDAASGGDINVVFTLQKDPAAVQHSVLIDGGNFVSFGNSYVRFDGFKVTNTNHAFDIKAEPVARITGVHSSAGKALASRTCPR